MSHHDIDIIGAEKARCCAYCRQHGSGGVSLSLSPPRSIFDSTLLLRHESYVATAQRERESMNQRIAYLEAENARLHAQNVAALSENRDLAEQVSDLNDAVIASDKTISSLQDTLADTHLEMERLRKLAARADMLDAELTAMELDKLTLQDALANSADEKKDADRKWAAAQRTIESLSAQMEIVELDAAEERRRHTSLSKRMESQAEERKTLEHHQRQARARERAVSDIVKQLLEETSKIKQQNVDLQTALNSSREEADYLRSELTHYRDQEDMRMPTASPNLDEELRNCRPPASNRVSLAPSNTSTLIEPEIVVESPVGYVGQMDKIMANVTIENLSMVKRGRPPKLPLRDGEYRDPVTTEVAVHAPKARNGSGMGLAALQNLLGR